MKKLLITTALAALSIPALALAQPGGPRGHDADTNNDGVVTLAEHKAAVASHFVEIDANRNGLVTQAEMKAFHEARMAEHKDKREAKMAERKAKMEKRLADATPEQRARFEKMRANREEQRGLRKEMREDRHEEMWAAADANRDGSLSLAEMQAHAANKFQKMDKNGNGQIDKDEKRFGKRGHHRGPGGRG